MKKYITFLVTLFMAYGAQAQIWDNPGWVPLAGCADTARIAGSSADSTFGKATITRCSTVVTLADTVIIMYIKGKNGRIIVLDTLELRKVVIADTTFESSVSVSTPVLTSPTGACTTKAKISSGTQWSEITFYGTLTNFSGGNGAGAINFAAPFDTGAFYKIAAGTKDTFFLRALGNIPQEQYGAWGVIDTIVQSVFLLAATDSIKTYVGYADSGVAVVYTDSTSWLTGITGNNSSKINSVPIQFASNRMWFLRLIVKATTAATDVKVWYDRVVYRYR